MNPAKEPVDRNKVRVDCGRAPRSNKVARVRNDDAYVNCCWLSNGSLLASGKLALKFFSFGIIRRFGLLWGVVAAQIYHHLTALHGMINLSLPLPP